MAKKSRSQRQKQGAKRTNIGKSQPRSYSQLQQGEGRQQSGPSLSVASPISVADRANKPASKPASKGKTPNIQKRSVNWKDEYTNVTDDLHMLMIVSILLFIVIIGAGSFMV